MASEIGEKCRLEAGRLAVLPVAIRHVGHGPGAWQRHGEGAGGVAVGRVFGKSLEVMEVGVEDRCGCRSIELRAVARYDPFEAPKEAAMTLKRAM